MSLLDGLASGSQRKDSNPSLDQNLDIVPPTFEGKDASESSSDDELKRAMKLSMQTVSSSSSSIQLISTSNSMEDQLREIRKQKAEEFVLHRTAKPSPFSSPLESRSRLGRGAYFSPERRKWMIGESFSPSIPSNVFPLLIPLFSLSSTG